MFADNMEVLRRNLARVGKLASPDAHARVRALIAENALELGYGQYWAGDTRAARRAYWVALRLTPSLRAAIGLAKTAVPPRVARRFGRAPGPDQL